MVVGKKSALRLRIDVEHFQKRDSHAEHIPR